MGNLLRNLSLPLLFSAFAAPLLAQEKQDLYDLSLEELMNVAIVSASSQEETLFDAPVSSYSITKEEIAKSGATSIPEALRLAPGVIVRETTNGNYDIHLRGFDNPVRHTTTAFQINVLTLVMINNRPVFSNGQGGTYWEGLPVDLIDVERIEIVRGPAAALFGPNAVTGVINIITKDYNNEEWHAAANIQYGTPSTSVANLSVSKNITDKLNFSVTGNYQNRERHDDQYYLYNLNTFVNSEEFRREEAREHKMALNKYGVNGYLSYELNENTSFDLSAGRGEGNAQKVHFADSIPLVFSHMESNYANLNAKVHGLNSRISYTWGVENLLDRPALPNSSAYEHRTFDAAVDYQWKLGSKIQIRPAVNMMRSNYDDTEFTNGNPELGILQGSKEINSAGASLRADVYPVENLRLVASIRGDKFSIKDDLLLSYQFLATYKLQDKWLFRAVHSRSTTGIYYAQALMDMSMPFFEPTSGTMWMIKMTRDPNSFEVASNTMTEVGVRGKISNNFQLDLTLFAQKLADLSEFQWDMSTTEMIEGMPTLHYSQMNLPFEVIQKGATLSANYVPSNKWQLKPFITLQATETENFYSISAFPVPEPETSNHESTPSIYGGLFANYAPNRKVNVNLNSYFFGQHTMYHQQDAMMVETTENQIKGKFLLNTKVSYQLINQLKGYVGGKNLLGQDSREYYGADRIGRTVFLGASYNF